VIDHLPAWSTNRLKRLSRTPKRYIIDSGLLAGILRVAIDDVLASAHLLVVCRGFGCATCPTSGLARWTTELRSCTHDIPLGSMIDTFVVAQLRAEATVARTRYRLSHLREQDGRREVDVIAELGGGRIVGIEIKASASVGRSDARHLEWLSGIMGDRFAGGAVLHTGPDTFELTDRVIAAPISTLWT